MTVFVIILCSFSSFISGICFFLGFDAWMESKEEFDAYLRSKSITCFKRSILIFCYSITLNLLWFTFGK